MEWTEVTPEQAARHGYYGLGGWLLFFYVLAALGFISNFVALADVAPLRELYGDSFGVILALTVVQALLLLPFLILAPMKHPAMPKATISALWLSVSLTAIIGLVTGPARLLPTILIGAAFVALFQWYLSKSKRVNVTYRHRVPAGTTAAGDGHG